jgi:hypothetical protein
MGARGSVLFRPREDDPEQWFTNRLRSEHIPSLVQQVVDPLGAGDACLAVATLTLATGSDAPTAAFLGMVAAAVQTSRVGNPVLDPLDLVRAVDRSSFMPRGSTSAKTLNGVGTNGARGRMTLEAQIPDRPRNHIAIGGSIGPDGAVNDVGHAGKGL